MKVTTFKLPNIGGLSEEPFKVEVPLIERGGNGPKVIYISEEAPDEDDIENGKYLSGEQGTIVNNALKQASLFAKVVPSKELFLYIPPCHSKTDQDSDMSLAFDRIQDLVERFKPDVIVLFGFKNARRYINTKSGKNLSPEHVKEFRGRIIRLKHLGRLKKVKILFTLPFSSFASLNPKRFSSEVNLIGFAIRDVEIAYLGKNLYTLPDIDKKKLHLIDNIEDYRKFYKKLVTAKYVSIDTEGKNLNRVYGNVLYCVLFCMDGKNVYMVPYMHPKSPFMPKELREIQETLKHYFEFGESIFHIYQNAKFDLLMFFSQLKIEFYNHKLYDLMVGEMNLDENRKFLKTLIKSTYSLKYITANRGGSRGYENTAISKDQRHNMAAFSLEEILEYGALDVFNPYHLAQFQIKEAKRRGPAYNGFLKAVTNIGSDKLLSFVEMERFGLPVDKDYIVSQMAPESAINKERQEYVDTLLNLPSVKKANEILCKQKGIPTKAIGLLSGTAGSPMVFSPRKEDHIQLLFFDVCAIQPLAKNAKGGGKTDKAFLSEYKDKFKEVEIVSEIRNLNVLANTYIKGLLKTLVSSEDNKDMRLRATYDFIRIITGRSGAKNPSLQNIPTHGRLAKIIKRIFRANHGLIMVKTDMSSHEVRLWGMLARDPAMARAFGVKFKALRELRVLLADNQKLDYEFNKFLEDSNWDSIKEADAKRALIKRQSNNPDLKRALECQLAFEAADLHRVNYSFLYKTDPLDVTKVQRSGFKAVVFGAIYERSARTLAITDMFKKEIRPFFLKFVKRTINSEDQEYIWEQTKKFNKEIEPYVEKAQALTDVMFNYFKKGSNWLTKVKEEVATKYHTVSIFGNVRHLWGMLHTNRSVQNKSIRRGPNSRVQGAASDCVYSGSRLFRECIWYVKVKSGIDLGVKQCNAVHDSSELETSILMLPLILYYLEHSYTTLVHKRLKDTFGFDPYIGLETDTEIGPHLGKMGTFNGSEANLLKLVAQSIDWQIENLGYDLKRDALLKGVRHNWRIVNKYWSKEMKDCLKHEHHKPNYTMLIQPEMVKDLNLITKV